MQVTKRIVAAGIVALVGVLIATYTLWPYLVSGRERANAQVAPNSPEQLRLTTALLDTDTAKHPDAAINAAVDRLGHVLELGTSQGLRLRNEQRLDLPLAFAQQLRTTIDGEYHRDQSAQLARGMRGPDQVLSESDITAMATGSDWTRGVRIGVDEIDVVWIRRNGQPIDDGAHDGYTSTLTFHSDYTPYGPYQDGEKPRDVIEVRIPMGLRPVRVQGGKEPQGAVLVGYQYAWHERRKQWTPYANVIYPPSGEVYAGLRFY